MNNAEFQRWLRRSPEEKKREQRLSKKELNKKYGLPENYRAPTEKDVARAVDEVAGQPADQVKRPGNGSRLVKRKGKVILNPCTVYFKPWGCYGEIPGKIEDVLIGCCRQSDNIADNTNINPRTVFAVLRALPFVTTEDVQDFLNRKRNVLQDAGGMNQRYAQYIVATCQRVINVFQHHHLFIENILVSNGVRVHVFDDTATQEEIDLCTLPECEPYATDYDNDQMSDAIRSKDHRSLSRGGYRFNLVHIPAEEVKGWCAYRGAELLAGCGVWKLSKLVKHNPVLVRAMWAL